MGITRQQALDCFASDDLIGIGMEADAVRSRLHPEGVASYNIDRSIDFRDINDVETIYRQVRETVNMGGTGVVLQGGTDPSLNIDWFANLFVGIKQRFPEVSLHCLSANEILAITKHSGMSLYDTIARLRDAGLDSLPGDFDCSTEEWVNVHRTAHKLGMKTAATMIFGAGETVEQRVDHLETVHELQNETGGFTAFVPLSFHPDAEALENRSKEEPTSVEYLKTLAISRMLLDNIDNMQSSWVNQGLKVLQMALRFGGNDLGSVMLEEGRGKKSSGSTEEELRRIIRDAGFKPVQRDNLYRTMFLD